MSEERPLLFDCAGERLVGILHPAAEPASDIGMLLVVGGPQYRVGSHRQFVLLARDLASAGVPVLRFDYRGMGDSEGEFRDFEAIDTDIRTAIDAMIDKLPTVRRIVLWGLCDAATANAFYALNDDRVVGQIAANPWVRTEEGEAQAFIRHYYLKRLFSRELWRKVVRGEFGAVAALKDFLRKWGQSSQKPAGSSDLANRPLPERLRQAQLAYQGSALLILSGRDLTAKEYLDRVGESSVWKAWLASPTVAVRHFQEADHTFSSEQWRNQVAEWTHAWINDTLKRRSSDSQTGSR